MKTKLMYPIIACILLCINTSVMSQSKTIQVNGIVLNEKKQALAGALISENGTSNKTQSDAKGHFSLSNVSTGSTLKISHSGYQTIHVKVKANLTILLKPAIKTIADEKTKAPSKSKKETALPMIESSNAMDAMQGKMAGIQVNETEASPDAYVHVRVRGGGSITAFNSSPAPQYNTEEYKGYSENRFKDPKADPLSTFSLDVDAASYSNMRRMINAGQLPDKNSVRVEELINYFSYNYQEPTGKDPVKMNTEVHPCPWNKKNLLLRIGVKAKEIPTDNLPASNFVFLLDVSGSMADANKLPLVKSSIKLLTNNMRAKDRIAIVVYAGAAGVVLESTPGDDKQKIVEAFEKLQAGGSTAGGAGIELAYKIAQKNFIQGGNNRIILCTDGDFNVGVSDEGGLESLIEAKRKTGIFLTVLGYGMGNYKDNKLQILAQKGNGNHAYIDNIQEANKVLVNEFGSTMYAVAKDVKLQVEFNPAFVSSYRLVGYESRLLNKEDFNDDTKDAGELGAGHTVTALYEIVPAGANITPLVDDLRYQAKDENDLVPDLPKAMTGNEICYVKLRYKPIDSDTSIKMEVPVKSNANAGNASDDYQFASAVAMFAQLLRDSDFKADGSYQKVIDLANNALNNDKNGYRREFIRLVESVTQMAK